MRLCFVPIGLQMGLRPEVRTRPDTKVASRDPHSLLRTGHMVALQEFFVLQKAGDVCIVDYRVWICYRYSAFNQSFGRHLLLGNSLWDVVTHRCYAQPREVNGPTRWRINFFFKTKYMPDTSWNYSLASLIQFQFYSNCNQTDGTTACSFSCRPSDGAM